VLQVTPEPYTKVSIDTLVQWIEDLICGQFVRSIACATPTRDFSR